MAILTSGNCVHNLQPPKIFLEKPKDLGLDLDLDISSPKELQRNLDFPSV